MTHYGINGKPKPHVNTITYGDCYYFRLRGEDSGLGHRVIFRANEIESIVPVAMGGIVYLRCGSAYRVDSPTPELIAKSGEAFGKARRELDAVSAGGHS